MPRRQRILLAVHPYFRPDQRVTHSQTEKDVWLGLKRAGFECHVSAVQDDLAELERDLTRHRPHVVFNLLEEFRSQGVFDFHVVSFLEAKGVPYTGCNPRGLVLSRNKLWTAQLASGAAVPVPFTWPATELKKKRQVPFPMILKLNNEHASLGLTDKSVVRSPVQLSSQIKRMLNRYGSELVAQEFVEGREVSVSVLGNRRPASLPPRELHLRSEKAIVTEKIKFNSKFRFQRGIRAGVFKGPREQANRMQSAALKVFRHMGLSGYARFDFRLKPNGDFYLIDVNANPNLERNEDFALSARLSGLNYEDLLRKIIRLAREYKPIS